jgi:hypothetical protein
MKGACGCVYLDGLIEGTNDAHGCMGTKVDCRVADGGEKNMGKFARVETVLFEQSEAMVARAKLREEMGQLYGGERVERSEVLMWECLKGGVGLK